MRNPSLKKAQEFSLEIFENNNIRILKEGLIYYANY